MTAAGLCQSGKRVDDDRLRIFAARIVGCKHHEITSLPCSARHQRTLCPIAISDATEERNDSSSRLLLCQELASDARQVAKSVVGMSIVHNNNERLRTIDALKPAGYTREARDRIANLIG